MIIVVDSREKPKAITKILKEFDKQGINHVSSKLYVGDYNNLKNPMVFIDRKQNIAEIIIGKQRNGPIGSVDLVFLKQLTRFEDKFREQTP